MKTSLLLSLLLALHAQSILPIAFAADGTLRVGSTASPHWQVGTPIVTYWAGPSMSDAAAQQMSDGGWNLVWCSEKDLDLVHGHGLRAQLHDPLLSPKTLDNPEQRSQLDALIRRVHAHPGLYSYFITDEPSAADFPGLARLVAYLREHDPAHLAYINLFPTYANNEQLGTKGETVTAYENHLQQYLDLVKPDLISYDHYQFTVKGDTDQYFLNLDLIRRAAERARVPFLNIVQACSWTKSIRVPDPDEMRYLVYTTLAYGAQGISYYVYSAAGHTGGIAQADGTPTPLYHALKPLNAEFVAIARQLQPLRLQGVYHAGHHPRGTVALPDDGAFTLDPPVPDLEYKPGERVQGVLLSGFAPVGQSTPTHAFVINLDYRKPAVVGVRAQKAISRFEVAANRWTPPESARVELNLPPGGGQLIRIEP
jgi:hypothetical protein